jgi:hypothetical protein
MHKVACQRLHDFVRVQEILTHGIKWVQPFVIFDWYVVKRHPLYFQNWRTQGTKEYHECPIQIIPQPT